MEESMRSLPNAYDDNFRPACRCFLGCMGLALEAVNKTTVATLSTQAAGMTKGFRASGLPRDFVWS